MSNANLNAAKKAKNDEFYTMYEDIEAELQHYPGAFQGKVVYCNCDNPEWSNFWRYFHENFAALGLKKLVSTHYERDIKKNGHPYRMEYEGGDDANIAAGVKTPLKGNGDFASDECIEILQQADIVVTNPPFNIARERYLPLLRQYEKPFLIIGDLNWVTYKSVFPIIKDGKIWIGCTKIKAFWQPDKTIQKFGNKLWFTNIDMKKRHEKLTLKKKYTPNEFQKYDNYDALNVDKVADIPCDYCESWEVTEEEFKNLPADEWEITRDGELDGEKSFFIIPAKGTPLRERLSEHRPGYIEGIEGELLKYIKKKDTVTELWESPLHLSDNIIRHNSQSLDTSTTSMETEDVESAKGSLKQEVKENSNEYLSERYCNGVAGVPITFLDKYNPEQFEIVNANDYRKTENVPVKHHGLIKDKEGAVKKNCVCQNMHQKDTVTALLEYQSHSSTSTTQHSLKSLGQQSQKERDSVTVYGLQNQELHSLSSISSENISDYLQERYCNGIIGVPVTFLDKMNPNQFKIIGRADGNIKYDTPECYIPGFADKGGAPMINTKFLYKRILIQKKL